MSNQIRVFITKLKKYPVDDKTLLPPEYSKGENMSSLTFQPFFQQLFVDMYAECGCHKYFHFVLCSFKVYEI